MRIESDTLKINPEVWGGQQDFTFPKGTKKVRIICGDYGPNSWRIRCYDSKGEKLATIYLDPVE